MPSAAGVILFLAVALFSGCATRGVERKPATVAAARPSIRVATFNIQNFGPAKAGRPEVMRTLAGIIGKYDVVAVQEVSDKSEKAPRALVSLLPGYAVIVSPRTGLQPDDKNSQEQYAFYFKTNTVSLAGSAVLFEDSQNDLFQREPFVARFRVVNQGFSFVLINIHTRPESAVAEICALDSVMNWAKGMFPDEDDFIALGDFNASCSYATPAQLNQCAIRGANYFWIVPDNAETNLATRKCAYDRIVLTAGTVSEYANDWGVDPAFTDKAISDHLPVWARFWSGPESAPHY